MNTNIEDYSQEEKIELFRESLNQLVANTDLSISVLYYVLKDYLGDVENLYEQFRTQVVESLNKKLEEQVDAQDADRIEEELKTESPDLKVTLKEANK